MPQQNTSTTQRTRVVPASIGLRLVVFLLDMLFVFLLANLVILFFEEYLFVNLLNTNPLGDEPYFSDAYYLARSAINVNTLILAIAISYHIMFELSSFQGSFAKKLFKIQVISNDQHKPSRKQILIRNAGKSLYLLGGGILVWIGDCLNLDSLLAISGFLNLGVWIIFAFMAQMDIQKRFFYDKWAGTLVVKKP